MITFTSAIYGIILTAASLALVQIIRKYLMCLYSCANLDDLRLKRDFINGNLVCSNRGETVLVVLILARVSVDPGSVQTLFVYLFALIIYTFLTTSSLRAPLAIYNLFFVVLILSLMSDISGLLLDIVDYFYQEFGDDSDEDMNAGVVAHNLIFLSL